MSNYLKKSLLQNCHCDRIRSRFRRTGADTDWDWRLLWRDPSWEPDSELDSRIRHPPRSLYSRSKSSSLLLLRFRWETRALTRRSRAHWQHRRTDGWWSWRWKRRPGSKLCRRRWAANRDAKPTRATAPERSSEVRWWALSCRRCAKWAQWAPWSQPCIAPGGRSVRQRERPSWSL